MTRRHGYRLLGLLIVSMTLVAAPPAGALSVSETSHLQERAIRPLADRVKIGAFVDGMHADPTRLKDFETLVGGRTDIASYYYGYGDVFPGDLERTFADGGRRKVLLSWDMGPTRFTEWSSGRHDSYLNQIASAARSYGRSVYVRPWPEMNGDWQSFQPTADGSRPHGGTYWQFKQAWRYVVSYLDARGATNLRWVFNPTADTYAQTTPVRKIWPGAPYVDVLGLDGFNWGKDATWGTWRPFRSIFTQQYNKLTDLHPTAPVWICEVSSKEPMVDDGAPVDPTHDKGAWIRTMLADKTMPRIKALVWFHADKERDWRVNSSPSALKGTRAAFAGR